MMVSDEQVVETLARAAGGTVMWFGRLLFICFEGVKKWVPLESRDDAHALLDALVKRLGNKYHDDLNDTLYGMWMMSENLEQQPIMFGLTVSPADLCRAMFSALPECGECGGSGKGTICCTCGELSGCQHKPSCQRQGLVTKASAWDDARSEVICPTCGGSGKKVA